MLQVRGWKKCVVLSYHTLGFPQIGAFMSRWTNLEQTIDATSLKDPFLKSFDEGVASLIVKLAGQDIPTLAFPPVGQAVPLTLSGSEVRAVDLLLATSWGAGLTPRPYDFEQEGGEARSILRFIRDPLSPWSVMPVSSRRLEAAATLKDFAASARSSSPKRHIKTGWSRTSWVRSRMYSALSRFKRIRCRCDNGYRCGLRRRSVSRT